MPGPTGRKLTRARIAEMLRYLQMQPRTKRQLAKFLGVSRTTAHDWMRDLHAAGCLHICAWTSTLKNNSRAAIYCWGVGDDVEKPRAMTSAQRTAKSRDRSTLDRAWRMPT